jgi:uncharacterized protein DUF4157/lysine-specific metallo-endopeptidase family protein
MGEISRLYAKTPDVQKSNSVLRIQKTKSPQPIKSPADRILFLQRTIGNQAVQRLIKSGTLQAKLKIGQPGDKYEQEADRVADAVMRMPEPGVQRQVEPEEEEEESLQAKPIANQITPLVQVQRQEEPEEEEEGETIQTKPLAGQNFEVAPGVENNINANRGSGQPLSANERSFFEPRFGRDFSQVRVHTDAKAARMVNAQAFTIGQNIVFGESQYMPNSTRGRKLLAHELTHVIQQIQGMEIRRESNRTPRVQPATHVIPCSDPAALRVAIRRAGTIISSALSQMASGPRSVPVDYRLYTPMHYFYTLFFKVEPGARSSPQILQINEGFRFIQQALSSAGTQCVSAHHPKCRSGQMLHNAFAEIGVTGRLINICPTFFNNSTDEQARTIIHELAHARLAVEHRGGRFMQFGCYATPVNTFNEAIDNAYVYDIFATCLHAAAIRRRRSRQTP